MISEERIREIAEGDNSNLVMTPEEKIELASALLAAQEKVRELEQILCEALSLSVKIDGILMEGKPK